MPIELPHAALANDASQLARCVGHLAERLEAGEQVDLDELCADCPQYREQLEMLLPTLQAVVELEHTLGSPQSPDLPSSPLPSSGEGLGVGVLGDFRILRELGRGGMGVVYEAEQLSIGRRVALKVLPFAAMLDRQQLNRFKNEARAAGTLDHPNIVAIHSVGVERGVHYYAMQLIEGESLAQLIARLRKERGASAPLPPDSPPAPSPLRGGLGRGEEAGTSDALAATELHPSRDPKTDHGQRATDTAPVAALSTRPDANPREYFRTIALLGVQAAEALDHAHQNGILHRDVKPANLMVDDSGKLWITDFGLARLEADAGMTMTGDLIGTLRYMSPEQAVAKRVVVDHRSDVYSLGATLYELLTLRPPFDADDRQELLRNIAFEEPRRPRQVDARIPLDLETIVLKAIEKNATDRYTTAQDMANDLRRFLEHHPIRARRPTILQHVRKWVRRHQSLSVVAIITLALSMVFTSAFFADRWRRAREGKDFVHGSLRAALASLESNDVSEASMRLTEAQTRIDANELGTDASADDVKELTQECDRYAKFEQLVQKARDQRAEQFLGNAERALALYQVVDDSKWLDRLRDAGLPEAHINRVTDYVYELLLLQADQLTRWQQNITPETTRRAIDLLEKAVSFHAPSRGYYWLLANCSLLLEDKEKADQLREKAMKTPVHHAAELFYINRDRVWGTVSVNRGYAKYSFEESYRDHREMLRFDPRYYNGLFFMAMRLNDERRYAEAMAAWYACIALQPDDWVAFYNRGIAFYNLGHYDEAIADFREALRMMKPDYPEVRLNLGNALLQSGQVDEAIATFRDAARLHPEFGDIYTNLGSALDQKGLHQEAITACERAIELEPGDNAPHFNLGNTYSHLARWDQAIAEYRQALELHPPDEEKFNIHVSLAVAFLAKHDDGNAIAQLTEATRIRRDNAEVDSTLAELLATCADTRLRDPQRSLELAKMATELAPAVLANWTALGIAEYRLGNYEAAIETLRKSSQGAGDNSPDYFFLAMAQWQLGNQIAAHESYDNALQDLESNPHTDVELARLIRYREEAKELIGRADSARSAGNPPMTEDDGNVN